MSVLALPFPNIDPVAVQIGPVVIGPVTFGPIAIKWYGLAYMAGLLLGWMYIRRLLRETSLWPNKMPPFSPEKADDLLLYMTFGVVLGGRLGFVLFYEPLHYLHHPAEIPQIWRGGMAFHGALVGCGLVTWLFARRNLVSPWGTMDLCAAAVPIGLLFGRLANFINGELFGRPTSVPWGTVFPEDAAQHPEIEPTPRHPSQLYEAFFEGLLLLLVLRWLTHRRLALQTPGTVTGAFLVGYGLARSFCELFREPDPLHTFTTGPFTPGIVYSLPMILLGLYFIRAARVRVARARGTP
jgi:phosphatidylglycerol:prolipoprotein diacylglycerol transferase